MRVLSPLVLAILPISFLADPAAAQMRVDARIQMSSGSCSGCDLSNKAMNGVRLNDANLSGSIFNNSNLSGGSLDGSNLSDAHFRSALMYRVKGKDVKMPGAQLEDATLTEAHLSNSQLANANLTRANLSRSIFSNTNFKGARFDNADLTGASFQNGQFQKATFAGTNLTGTILDDANFSGADLSGAQGLQQVQLDFACGDSRTRLPVGLSLSYCGDLNPSTEAHSHDDLAEDMAQVALRLDRAISDVENLLAAANPRDRALRTRLQRIHSDLVQSKAAIAR